MKGFILLIPLLAIRYGLLYLLDRQALSRAAHYPPMVGKAKTAGVVYQLSSAFLLIYLCFTTISTALPVFLIGLLIYLPGTVLLIVATMNFAKPLPEQFCVKGLYRISRNPMYVAYFLYFLGCACLTRSVVLFIALVVFQVSSHWLILAEEKWCLEKWKDDYKQYMEKVRRYL